MPQPRRTHASAPVWCVALYFLIASALGCTALGLLEGPVAVLVTCLGLAGILTVLSLVPEQLPLIAKTLQLIVVILLVPTVAMASPHLSDVVRWVVALAAASLTLCLLVKVPVGHDQWGEAENLNEPCGYVAAPWIAHLLWIGFGFWTSAVVCAAGGALWHLVQLHWAMAGFYSTWGILAALITSGWIRLQEWLIADHYETGEPTSPVPPAESNLTPRS